MTDANSLGTYLKDRRAKLDPTAFGFPLTRRRTPGLRREEVAQLSGISATWYTWLEQGRPVSVSPHALSRVARTLGLSPAEIKQYGPPVAGTGDAPEEPTVMPNPLQLAGPLSGWLSAVALLRCKAL